MSVDGGVVEELGEEGGEVTLPVLVVEGDGAEVEDREDVDTISVEPSVEKGPGSVSNVSNGVWYCWLFCSGEEEEITFKKGREGKELEMVVAVDT